MATKLTDTGVEFPGNGTDPVEQSKAIKNVEGNEADSTGKITLSTVSGKTLDERLTEIEELGSGGGAVYLEQNTFGTNNYMFKDSYWWGGESVYSYSSANATQQTAIENLERGNVLNLSSPNSSEYYHVSSVDSASKRITLIRGTFNDRSGQNLTIDDAENGTFSAVNLTHVSSVTPAVTTGSWLQIEAGSNYSGSTISTTNGIGFAPMNLSTLPSEATHILFRVTSETSGHLIIYNREHFLTRSSSSPILESEKVHQIDVESSGSQSSSDEFWVPNNSFLQFWLTGSGTAHLYPVAYAVMDLSKVNLDGASIPAVNALSDEIIDLQNQVNSNDADISILQTDVTNLESDVLVLQQGGGGGGDVALYAPPENLFLDTNLIDLLESGGNDWTYGPSNNQTHPNPTYIVSEFENFFTNHSDKYKLTLYSGDRYTEVLIEDLVSFFAPASNTSSTKQYYIHYDDTNTRDNEEWIEYKDNDLIFRAYTPTTTVATHFRTYRIDMHLNAFGGGVTSLNNKTGDLTVSAGTGIGVTSTSSPNGLQISNSGVTSVNGDTGAVNLSNTYYTQTQVNDLISSSGSGGGGGGNVVTFLASTQNWVKPEGVEYLEIVLVGGGRGGFHSTGTLDYQHALNLGGNSIITFSSGDSVTALGGGQSGNPSTSKHGFGGRQKDVDGMIENVSISSNGPSHVYISSTSVPYEQSPEFNHMVVSKRESSSGLRTIYGDRESSEYNPEVLVTNFHSTSSNGNHPDYARAPAGLAIHKPSEYTFTQKWNILDYIVEVPYYQAGPYNGSRDADIRGTGGGANGTTSLRGGDGGGGDVATLGGDGATYFNAANGKGGKGNLGAGGQGYNHNYRPQPGGSGAGSAGVGTASGSAQSGEIKVFQKKVPAAAATYTIVIGSGGNGYYNGGGGGQGICIIRY